MLHKKAILRINILWIVIPFFILFFYIFNLHFNIFPNKAFEPLTMGNNGNKIVLIGDSILNNSMYVPIGSSVADNIKLKIGTANVFQNAKDGATIESCHQQLNNILDSDKYYIFISIGGNNMINKEITDVEDVNKLFEKYKKLLETIKIKYPKIKIYLLNLYFPTDEKYLKYTEAIIRWNTNISSLSSKYNILKIDELLKDDIDFTRSIEPSIIGSQKIANAILSV